MICSMTQRILLIWALNSFSQSSRSRWAGFLNAVSAPVPTYPWSPGPVGSGVRCEGAGFAQAVRVVAGAVHRVGDPHKLAVKGADDLHVQAGGLVLAGVQLRVCRPGPARQQRAVDQVLLAVIELVGCRHVAAQRTLDQTGQRADRAADRRLRHLERLGDLGLHPIPAQVRQGDHDRLVQSKNRRPGPFVSNRFPVNISHRSRISGLSRPVV
jgi:hypothetical protein